MAGHARALEGAAAEHARAIEGLVAGHERALETAAEMAESVAAEHEEEMVAMRAAAKIGAEAREAAELKAAENKAHWRKALEELKDKERQGKAMHAEIVKLGNRPLKDLGKAPP